MEPGEAKRFAFAPSCKRHWRGSRIAQRQAVSRGRAFVAARLGKGRRADRRGIRSPHDRGGQHVPGVLAREHPPPPGGRRGQGRHPHGGRHAVRVQHLPRHRQRDLRIGRNAVRAAQPRPRGGHDRADGGRPPLRRDGADRFGRQGRAGHGDGGGTPRPALDHALRRTHPSRRVQTAQGLSRDRLRRRGRASAGKALRTGPQGPRGQPLPVPGRMRYRHVGKHGRHLHRSPGTRSPPHRHAPRRKQLPDSRGEIHRHANHGAGEGGPASIADSDA